MRNRSCVNETAESDGHLPRNTELNTLLRNTQIGHLLGKPFRPTFEQNRTIIWALQSHNLGNEIEICGSILLL